MSKISFENYGKLSESDQIETVVAGRYPIQREAEKLIPLDIVKKLSLKPEDTLMEIGCGTGNLLIPLCFFVNEATGIDHPNAIERLKKRFNSKDLTLIPGNFFDLKINKQFSKILIYSVLLCLSDENEVIDFIQKALDLLSPNGQMLLGDIPNKDLKRRFLSSGEGRSFQEEWAKKINTQEKLLFDIHVDPKTVDFDDAMLQRITDHVAKLGYESAIMRQPQNLPFGNTREDILIYSPDNS